MARPTVARLAARARKAMRSGRCTDARKLTEEIFYRTLEGTQARRRKTRHVYNAVLADVSAGCPIAWRK